MREEIRVWVRNTESHRVASFAVLLVLFPSFARATPDLVPAVSDVGFSFGETIDEGDLAEGCARERFDRDLLRFSTISRNVGNEDLFVGDPRCPNCAQNPLARCGNPDFICSPAGGHNHPHFDRFVRYELVESRSGSVLMGHKQSFCLRDSGDLCPKGKYTCENQGITAGCSDVYFSTLGCQYLDVTGAAPGHYLLRVAMDPENRIPELNENNNEIEIPVTIPASSATACTDALPIPANGGTFSANTSGVGTLSGSCGPTSAAPEKVYVWTPQASGTATISTCGSEHNAAVYLRRGNCRSGLQVGCASSWNAPCAGGADGATLSMTVTAGETYFIVVDGFNGSRGVFRLTVSAPGSAGPTATRTRTPIATRTPTATRTPSVTRIPTVTRTANSTGSRTFTPSATPSPIPCAGDCDGTGDVSVDELVLGVSMALGLDDSHACPALDEDGNGRISIDEIVAAVRNSLDGCV